MIPFSNNGQQMTFFFYPLEDMFSIKWNSIDRGHNCTMVRFFHCDLEVVGLKHRKSLSACRGKAAYVQPFLDPANGGSLVHGAALIFWNSTDPFELPKNVDMRIL